MKTTKNNEEKKRKREPHNVSVADRLFRRLQIKFTAIVSAICVALVAICFVAATVANLVNMELSINDALDSALDSSWESLLPDGEEPDAENSSDCAIIIVSGGSVIASSLYTYMDDQTMYSLVNSAARGETDVEYDGRNYRMAMRQTSDRFLPARGMTIAVYDYTVRRHAMVMQNVALSFALGGLAILLVLLSYLISGSVLAPARDSLVKQKELIANAGHELKTPVTIINANLEVINADPELTVKEDRKWLDNISAQTARMSSLITEMLEMSGFEAAEYVPDIREFDLGALAEGSCLSFEAACFEKGASIQLSRDENMVVAADERGWNKLIGILLDNAVKYSPVGGKITVELRADCKQLKERKPTRRGKARPTARGTVTFRVTNGGTVPPEETERIFDRFHKISDRSDSFGLGLAMAKTITENMNGKIRCESADGKTTFTVTAPVTMKRMCT
mgnify:FL=1